MPPEGEIRIFGALPGLGVRDVRPLEIPARRNFSTSSRGSLGLVLLGEPFHRADGVYDLGGLRLTLLLELLRAPTTQFKAAPALHVRVKHLNCVVGARRSSRS